MRKIVSLILALCMIASMSVTAFATENGEPVVTETQTLQEAVAAAGDGGTVTVDESAATTDSKLVDVGGAVIDEKVTIDMAGNDITISSPSVGSSGTTTIGLQVLNQSEGLTIKSTGETATITMDGDLDADGTILDAGTVIDTKGTTLSEETMFDLDGDGKVDEDGNPWLKRGIQNYSNLVLDNVVIDGTDLANNAGAVDGRKLDYVPNYENIVVSINNGSMLVDNGAGILAAEGDVAFDVYAYTKDTPYTDGADVVIGEKAGEIRGTIVFDGSEDCAKLEGNDEPSLTIKGGTFENFVLKIGEAVANFVDNITISGGKFSSNTVETEVINPNTNKTYVFDDFVIEGYEAVQEGEYWIVRVKNTSTGESSVVVVAPKPASKPAAPAPAPAPTAKVVASEPVAVEVNGTAVEVVVEAKEIKAKVVAPVAAGEAAQLKVTLAPAALEVEGVETEAVVEAMVASVSVEVKDGETIAADSYEITFTEDGELNIELSAEYLEKLGPGKHIIVLKIGGIEVEFTVVVK